MSLNDIIDFIRENPVSSIATTDEDQPRVRAFLTVLFGDEKCLYFTTAASKSIYKQISKNPKIELCYCSKDFSRMLRITGVIEIVDDRKKKQTLIDERDYLKGFKADDPDFKLLRLSHGKGRFWSLENNTREDEVERIEF